MLRSIRYGEADRVLHLYSADRGRVGAVAKGARRVRSRLGGRLEPLARVKLVLHEGRGELCTVTAVDTVHAHPALRESRQPLERAASACDAVLRLFDSAEPNRPAYNLLCNQLALLDADPAAATRAQSLAFRMKLLLAAGFAPELALVRVVRRGRGPERLLARRRRRGVRELRGGVVPARRGRPRVPGRRPGATRSPRRRPRPTARWPRPTARSPRRWSTTRTCGCGAWRSEVRHPCAGMAGARLIVLAAAMRCWSPRRARRRSACSGSPATCTCTRPSRTTPTAACSTTTPAPRRRTRSGTRWRASSPSRARRGLGLHGDHRPQRRALAVRPGFGDGLIGIPAYENSLDGHAQMLGATADLRQRRQVGGGGRAPGARSCAATAASFQVNHPAEGATADQLDWKLAYAVSARHGGGVEHLAALPAAAALGLGQRRRDPLLGGLARPRQEGGRHRRQRQPLPGHDRDPGRGPADDLGGGAPAHRRRRARGPAQGPHVRLPPAAGPRRAAAVPRGRPQPQRPLRDDRRRHRARQAQAPRRLRVRVHGAPARSCGS